MNWELLEIEELMDGRVWVKWRTIADDGHPLVEGGHYTPETDDIETEVEVWLLERQAARQRINAAPKLPRKATPRVKRTTARMDAEARQRLAERVKR